MHIAAARVAVPDHVADPISKTVSVWVKVTMDGKNYICDGEGVDLSSAMADAERNAKALISRR